MRELLGALNRAEVASGAWPDSLAIEYPGALHHVMSRGNDGILIFRDDEDRRWFLQLLAEEASRSNWIVHDYCLMGNHYHLVIETPECTLSTGMHRLLSRHSRRFNKRHGRRGHLFQERFKNVLVESEPYGLELSRYVALNPVRAGLVERPEQWEWSSYAARAGFAEAPAWLTVVPLSSQFGPDLPSQQSKYREFVLSKTDAADDLMSSLTASIYLGTAQWIQHVQKLLDSQERSEEHPRDQVHPGRPDLTGVMEAVAKTFDTTVESIRAQRGTLERRLVAWFSFEEGLIPLRRIAKELGVTSAGGISDLVSRCRRELCDDPDVRAIANACRDRMPRQRPPFVLREQTFTLPARRYHRAAAHSRR